MARLKDTIATALLVTASLTSTVFSSHANAADLEGGARAEKLFSFVKIYNFLGATSEAQYTPANPRSVALYQGTVEIELLVEGNICSGDPASFGLIHNHDGKHDLLSLVTTATKGSMCLHYSKPTKIFLPLDIYIPEFSGQPVDRSLGVIKYFDQSIGQSVYIDIRFQASNGVSKIVPVEL
ncbi:MAG: hypothetical protein RBT63_06110 [Bdellovibrionales bacterium]|nr:hypothetical protein [Bdellovibrionales bacterium]